MKEGVVLAGPVPCLGTADSKHDYVCLLMYYDLRNK